MTEEASQSLRAFTIDADNSDVSDGSDVLMHDSSDETTASTQASAVTSDQPYVVVLIDAHTHHLTSAENEGSRVAELLEEAVHDAIGPKAFQEGATRTVVDVYVDLASLFKQQVRSRSLRRVPGGSRDLFEAFFVEFTERFSDWTLNDMRTEHGVETKIMEAFETYAEDAQCTKIFFAGWQRSSYFAGLSDKPDKVTLVQGHSMAPGLERMNIRGPNKIPMALDNTTFAEVFVPPQGQDWFRRNFGSVNSCFKDWLCSASIQGECGNSDCQLAHLPSHSIIVPDLTPTEPETPRTKNLVLSESRKRCAETHLTDPETTVYYDYRALGPGVNGTTVRQFVYPGAAQ